MDDRMEYLRSKRLSMMAISVSQFILGSICVLLWTAGIEFCQNCYNPDKDNIGCQWTSTLQGAWGGGIVLICGFVGVIQSISPSSSRNSKYIIISIASVCASLGMITLEVLVKLDVLKMNQSLFIEHCLLPSTHMVWDYFHYTMIGLGGLCFILGVTSSVMAGYAQCGCCGVYCDTEADRQYNRTYSNTVTTREERQPQHSGSFCVHSCIHHTCNQAPPTYQERENQLPVQTQQEVPLPSNIPDVDDLLRIEPDEQQISQQENLIDLEDRDDRSSITPHEITEDEREPLSPPPPYSC